MAFLPSNLPPPGRPVAFPDWRQALADAKLSRAAHGRFATEISRFLRYCEILQVPITFPRARDYLARVPVPPARPIARQALHWYFQAARRKSLPLDAIRGRKVISP